MKSLPARTTDFLVQIVPAILPAARSFDDRASSEFLHIIDEALLTRPAAIRRRVAVFLFLLRYSSLIRFGASLDRLNKEKQKRVFMWFQDNPVFLFRAGFWGVKTLVFMGYYGRPEIGPHIRYAPSRNGNETLRD